MFWIDVLSRIVHISTAIALVGGSVFSLLVLLPAASHLGEAPHQQLAAAITARWKKFVHLGVALFLISGIYNFARAIPLHRGDSTYHMLIGIKMLLAFVVFFLAAALVGRSEKLVTFRRHRRKWLTVLVVLAAIIVAISGYAKVRGVPAESVDRSEIRA